MKKPLQLLLILTTLLMALPALAATTQEEWDDSCNWVIAADATLYAATLREDATNMADVYDFSPVGVLPAGTKVAIRSTSGSMREIWYWQEGQLSAWVEASAVRWAGGESAASAFLPAYTEAWSNLTVTLTDAEGQTRPVTLQQLGSAQSVVWDGERMLSVATASLSWESEADAEHRLAFIYAPKSGKATLRATASTKGKSLAQCGAGRLVIVLKVGETFSRVLHDGQEGFVLNDALTFTGVIPATDAISATLIHQGDTDSSAAISVYTSSAADRRIDQWRAGHPVAVISTSGAWAEIEIAGYHGWVRTEHLK